MKVKNKDCRFSFKRFFSSHTVIAKPIEKTSEHEKFCLLKKTRKYPIESQSIYK